MDIQNLLFHLCVKITISPCLIGQCSKIGAKMSSSLRCLMNKVYFYLLRTCVTAYGTFIRTHNRTIKVY